jgi:large conductance mechanosensitive channel
LATHLTTPGWVADFKAFILRGKVVDLAVGIVIGAAFTGIVSSLVKDLLTPIIGLLVGGIDFSNIFIVLKPLGTHFATLDDAKKAGAVTLNIGIFANACIQFIIIAFAIFWLVQLVSRLNRPKQPGPTPPPTATEVLLTEIRDALMARP